MKHSLYELDCFLQSEQVSKFNELSKKILEKKFTATQVGVSHRWITFWDERRLLPSITEKGKWKRLLRHPILTLGIMFIILVRGIIYATKK